jgi:hypothetical protein
MTISNYFRIAIEPRWPAFAIGFHKRKFYSRYTFTIVLWALVIEIGDLS